jgi:hypothetical protein
MDGTMRSRAWAIYLVIGGALLAAFVFRASDPRRSPVQLIGPLRVHRDRCRREDEPPTPAAPWYLVATGQALFVAGDVIT